MKYLISTSSGFPSLSYIAKKKSGSMTVIMQPAARELLPVLFTRKNTGIPIAAPMEKQISCRLVSPMTILVFTFDRSLGT